MSLPKRRQVMECNIWFAALGDPSVVRIFGRFRNQDDYSWKQRRNIVIIAPCTSADGLSISVLRIHGD
ncbi:MAG: hypothetical protein WAN46_07240 [Gammaproteobacteria bacterium]